MSSKKSADRFNVQWTFLEDLKDASASTNTMKYSNLLEQISSLILETYPSASGRLIKFETLIKHLHAQVVHYDGKHYDDNKCPDDCSQKTVCGRIRDVLYLLDQIVKKMSEEFPIFKDVIAITVGSIKEQTKIGKIDETDVLLAMDKKYQKYFEFHEYV